MKMTSNNEEHDNRPRFKDIPRYMSFIQPPVNPFVHRNKLLWYHYITLPILAVTVVPIRFVLTFIIVLFCTLVSIIITIGHDSNKPLNKSRKFLVNWVLLPLGRLGTIVCGYYCVYVKGQRVSAIEAPILVAAPHTSMVDVVVFFFTRPLATPVLRKTNFVLFRKMLPAAEAIMVSRDSTSNRHATAEEIIKHATSKGAYNQIVMFPEGTCTNAKALINFKAGAFAAGVPVQAMIIRHLDPQQLQCWTVDGPGWIEICFRILANLYNSVQIEFLDVYNPSEAERADPKLYAENVRIVMADALGIPCTNHSYEDVRLVKVARKYKLPYTDGLIEFSKISRKLNMSFEDVEKVLKQFASIKKGEQYLTLEAFASYLKLPVTAELTQLFVMYDRDETGYIDFREYIIGLALVTAPSNTEETYRLLFKALDPEDTGFISLISLTVILNGILGLSDHQCKQLFDSVEKSDKDRVSFAEFSVFINKKPEFSRLFTLHQELKQKIFWTRPVSKSLSESSSETAILDEKKLQ